MSVLVAGAGQAQELVEQWALAVIQRSSAPLSTSGSIEQIIGPANSSCTTSEFYDFVDLSWAPMEPDAGAESVEVRFAQPVYATAVEVYETLNPGAVTAIKVRDSSGQWQAVWAGDDTARVCPSVLRATFPSLGFPTSEVRVELNTAKVPGWNQLDAVKLIGHRAEGTELLFEEIPADQLFPPTQWQQVPGSLASYAFSDYDNDGWPDMFGQDMGLPDSAPQLLLHNEGDGSYGGRHQLIPDPRDGTWSNAGLVYGDYDNDGDLDLYVARGSTVSLAKARDQLLRNDDGHFTNVTVAAELTDSVMSSTALWFDFDRDAWLDLYVGHGAVAAEELSVPNALYRNNGDGTFTDVTASAGVDLNFRTPGSVAEGVRGTMSANIAADFNDDGWPDLQISVEGSPNRLLLNDRQGGFRDATTAEVGHPGFCIGAAVGDIDNDGDLDLFQPALGGDELGFSSDLPERSAMLLNLGGGQFVDVTKAAGLAGVTGSNIAFSRFWDIDNDGDLDLLTTSPSRLFLNDGSGLFTEATYLAGLPGAYVAGDYDGDGFLDVWFEQFFFRNRGNTNHWLRLDLVGTQSNRDGIGARAYARTGSTRQTRELSGGDGWFQDELMVHFGLGQATQVDELEIRWPSGQVDVLTAVPADQEIRVIEGRGLWYPAPRSVWTVPPPKSVVFGQPAAISAVCRPALFEPTAQITRITGDLSGLGGPAAVPLTDRGDGTYELATDFIVGGTDDLRDVEVFIEQQTSLGRHWINLSRNVEVVGEPTAVAETRGDGAPRGFALEPNWPNPFNSSTVIRYSLPAAGEVDLAIYDLAGQRVAQLASGHRVAGNYQIRWDGRDGDGDPMASGVYLVRLGSGSNVQTRRLTLLR